MLIQKEYANLGNSVNDIFRDLNKGWEARWPHPERAVRVRALPGDIVLCSWARHFTLTVPLSTQVY